MRQLGRFPLTGLICLLPALPDTGAGSAPSSADTIYCSLAGYHPIAVSELARRSVEIAKKVLER